MNLVSFFSSQSFGGVTFGNEFIGNHAYDVALIECRSIVSLASVRSIAFDEDRGNWLER